MRRSLFVFILIITAAVSRAQLQPVVWTYGAKKTADRTYEVEIKATIKEGWHLFSQTQPADAIAIPIAFAINPNPLLIRKGALREIGKLEKYKDKTLGVTAYQYAGQVRFVQTVMLKAKARTVFAGTVEFQTCDDEKCLPPQKVNFSIPLQ
ncbi:MAG: protein-disulfide reductase DsbD domain-containing protein [Sphingomonadales bacterium]